MKSKKFLSTMLAVAICILAFAGCNKQQEGVMQGESSNSSQSGAEATKDFAGKEIVSYNDTEVSFERIFIRDAHIFCCIKVDFLH